FEPYTRETRFGVKKVAGTGLGMPIVKNLVTQMSGQIHVESQPGKGTIFTIVIPFAAVKEEKKGKREQTAKQSGISLEGRTVLLAEDNMVNMEIATEILTMEGIKVIQAWNGAEAVERFRESSPFSIDAILMDMQMPQMDGCEAARTIRSLIRPDAGTVPIIAVTANAFAEDIAATTAAGMNAHVSKPIDFQILRQTLEELIGGKKR
ncbi:MAG TPA: response regulator, partial [Candidatus Lachnoclostridium stercorigallinarum]|nr:response regulator [Candidatus Lachnoclostridium stercorigallinarum]